MSSIIFKNGKKGILGDDGVWLTFLTCILSVFLFVFGHTRGIGVLLYGGALLMLMNFVLFSKHLLCLELFYIPLATILKLSPGGAALFSYISVVGVVVSLISKRIRIKPGTIFALMGLFGLLLLKEIFQSFGLQMNYIRLILIMLSVAFCLFGFEDDEEITVEKIHKAGLFLSAGVLVASIVGYLFADNARLSRFFSTTDHYFSDGELISRFCGVSADPNYYASLVVFAVAINLFMYIYRPRIHHIVFSVILVLFGLLSLSKMFLILLVLVVLTFVISFVITRNLSSQKGFMTVIFTCVALALGGMFLKNSETVQIILVRMSGGNIDSFTTGRFDTWIGYLEALNENVVFLFFGTNDNLGIVGDHRTHNTLLQMLWKIGVVGFICMVTWFVSLSRSYRAHRVSGTMLLFVGVFGAAMALDLLFFEQLYWFFGFALLCRKAIDNEKRYMEA